MTMKSTRRVLGHSLLRSLVRSHRSLIRLLRTARFARALRCAHSLARSLTHSLRSSWGSGFCLQNERVDFISFEPTVQWLGSFEEFISSRGRGLFSVPFHTLQENSLLYEWEKLHIYKSITASATSAQFPRSVNTVISE